MSLSSRNVAADSCLTALDADFFKALCEPSRLEIVRCMIKIGRADISDLSREMPLDRSVVSRHLQVLEQAGIAVSRKEGRKVYYELDGPAIMDKFGTIVGAIAPLVSIRCPGSDPKPTT